jgi:hypothetical protein
MLAQASMHVVHEYNDVNKQGSDVQACSRGRISAPDTRFLFSMNVDAGCLQRVLTIQFFVLINY